MRGAVEGGGPVLMEGGMRDIDGTSRSQNAYRDAGYIHIIGDRNYWLSNSGGGSALAMHYARIGFGFCPCFLPG
jgi:hypothetical protein